MPKRSGKSDAAVAQAGKRYPLNMRTTFEVRSKLEAAADAAGRSLAQEAEFLIERALQYDIMLAAMNTSLPEIAQRNAEAALRARGYTPKHSPHGNVWYPPGHPEEAPERSSFIAPEEDR